ncbi:uncharacterized protein LOC108051306 [Drosophila rhopaloa]|uniref:CCDC113/CCDC96 coiled-coil domain-containing protein n=1 Tax=Drosophila rhopaloa TaxID=1041015 RepID=A0ABM5I223_DRORH|nr:uncharacterized protein LOC108051306 [Drosophila rhopaloa]
METETSAEIQDEILQEIVDRETLVTEAIPPTSPGDEASVHDNVSTQSSQTSEMLVKSVEKEERLQMLREVNERLKEREKEEQEINEIAEHERQILEKEKRKRSLANFQRQQSRFEKEEEEEQLLWNKLDNDVGSDHERIDRHSDLAAFTTSLNTADDEVEDSNAPIESSSETEPEVLETGKKRSINPMQTVVKTLMLVPNLSDISLQKESEFDLKTARSQKSVRSRRLSVGDADKSFDSESFEGETGESHNDAQTVIEDRSSSSKSLRESMSDGIIPDVPLPEPKKPETKKYMDFEDFLVDMQEDIPELEVDENEELQILKTQKIVSDFITHLIQNVITAERRDEEYIRKRLDKEKLLAALQSIVHDHILVKDSHRQLQERVVDYYRRMKNKRPFAELPQAEEMIYCTRHDHALAYLSFGLERVAKAKEKFCLLSTKATLDLNHAMQIAVSTEEHLEQAVRRLLVRPDAETDFLKRFVARELRLMADFRNQISYTRLLLISQKHTLGRITEKIKEIEVVCDGVSMKDFIMTQTKVFGLEKKIEERNLELSKQRSQYHTDLHLTKHHREKTLGLKSRIAELKVQLIEKNNIKNEVKKELCRAKLEHKKIRGRINELNYQGGILATPALMYDYDRTVAYIREKEKSVASLKETLKSIDSHLQSLLPHPTKSLLFLHGS